MARTNPEVDTYIAQAAPFARPILKHLRKIVHAGCPAVEETIKWGMPFFLYKGNLAHMAAFKEHCAFGFWNGSLFLGPDAGKRSDAMGHFGRITSPTDLPNDKTLLGYVRKAAELNEAGVRRERALRPKRPPGELHVPAELTAALSRNAKARKTFQNFSYSKRKEYLDWIAEAKREATRRQRLTTAVQWMAEGKSRMWKYQP